MVCKSVQQVVMKMERFKKQFRTLKLNSVYLSFMVATAILCSAGSASAAVKLKQSRDILLEAYQNNRVKLETSSFGIPLYLDSFERGARVHVDVYGIFEYSFSSVVNALKVPSYWCDIVALHPNVKACTYGGESAAGVLTFYVGKKIYQPPEDTRKVLYRYKKVDQQKGYLDVILDAAEGPFGTEDHKMRFEAIPLKGGRTFVQVSYAYSDSTALRLAGKAYFATIGHNKVGFTVTGKDDNGKPVYIGGARGAIERNAVRYYFAIQSFMNTLHTPENRLFSSRINNWYDLSNRYRKQLFDLEKKEYLESKSAEHENQLNLQKRIEKTPQ